MPRISRKLVSACFVAVLFFIAAAHRAEGQQGIDPTYQIQWPLIVGSGAPSATCQNAFPPLLNYASAGQVYLDATNKATYFCGGTTPGWIQQPSANLFGSGAPAATCSAAANNGAIYTNTASTTFYICSGSTSTWDGPFGSTGPQGPAGPQGPPIQFTGAWSSSSSYTTGQAVSYSGTSYISLTGNTNVTPTGTCTANATWGVLACAGGGTIAGNIGQVVVVAPGNAGSGLNAGANVNTTSGTILDTSGSRSTLFGWYTTGNSISTNSFGCTVGANCWPNLINARYNMGPYAAKGDPSGTACDTANTVFGFFNPVTYGNPNVTVADGTNDANLGTGTNNAIGYSQCEYATITWLSMALVNKIPFSNSTYMTQAAGTWNNYTTYSSVTGLTTTTGGTINYSTCVIPPSGVVDIWSVLSASDTGTWQFFVNGIAQTDTITKSNVLSAQILANPPGVTLTTTPVMARFYTGLRGQQSCSWVATASPGNPVTLLSAGFPPALRFASNSGPAAFVLGVYPQGGNANATALLFYDALNQAITSQVHADGLYAKFIPMQSVIDYNIGFQSSGVIQNCPASLNAPVHPGDCPQELIAAAVIDAIQPGTVIPLNMNTPTSGTGFSWNPQNCTGTATSFCYSFNWYNNPSSAAVGETFLNLANIANAGAGLSTFFANVHLASASGFSAANAYCTTSTYPTTQANQLTCGTLIANNNVSHYATSAGTSSQSYDSSGDFYLGSGNNGTSEGNDTWEINSHYTSSGAAANNYFGVRNTASTSTGQKGFFVWNNSNFGFTYRVDGETVNTIGRPGFGLKTPNGTPTLAAGTNVTSVASASGYPAATNTRGTLTIVGGTATTGTIATVTFNATQDAAPWCTVTENGNTTFLGLGAGAASTTAFTITSAVTVSGLTFNVDYQCRP